MSNKSKKTIAREYLWALFCAILIALFIRTWGVQAFQIPTGSMEPTLLVGDHLLVNKSAYGIHIPHEIDFGRGTGKDASSVAGKMLIPFGSPARGDIIVFRYPEDRSLDFIKRVIGLPGEKVQVVNKTIYINDRPLEDPWGHYMDDTLAIIQKRRNTFGPVIVPEGHYFVMGDNRDSSSDSRYWFNGRGGFVPEQDILGKALIIYWSWEGGNSYDVRWSRLGNLIR